MYSVCQMAFFGFMRCGEISVIKKNEINDSILIEEFLLAGDIHAFV